MRITLVPTLGALLFGAALTTAAPPHDAVTILQDLQKQAVAKLAETSHNNNAVRWAKPGHGTKRCTLANAAVRRDWYVTISQQLAVVDQDTLTMAPFTTSSGSTCPNRRGKTTSEP